MSSANLEEEISSLFQSELHIEVKSKTTDLVDAGLLDSMAFVDLLALLEQKFGIIISPEMLEVDNFKSVERIATFVSAQRQNGTG